MNNSVALLEPEMLTAQNLPLDRLRPSGLVVRMGDPQAAMEMLDQLLTESDPAEDRETMEFLMKAIDEHRAAVGARLLFPDQHHEQDSAA
jgi:hypothetical protein